MKGAERSPRRVQRRSAAGKIGEVAQLAVDIQANFAGAAFSLAGWLSHVFGQ